MAKRESLQFVCVECQAPIGFSPLEVETFSGVVVCPNCKKKYRFDDETLLRHLRQFESLCREIHASKEILGNTSIAVDVGTHHVKVPFNILLTRMSSVLELAIGDKKTTISFRVEPLLDVQASS